ncbi:hypothetical protein NC652_011034 [Populus alba x Populus x berolinensis]|nr:hypothetical protein NC652_011034 [Populus alba x Populus x berolinensis]
MKNLEISRCNFECPLNLHVHRASLSAGFSTLFHVTVSAEHLRALSMKFDSTSRWRESIFFKVLPQDLMSLQDVTIKFLRFDSFSDADICNRILRIVRYAEVIQMSFKIIFLVELLPSAVENYQSQHGNSETLLSGDQLMKLKIKLLKNE